MKDFSYYKTPQNVELFDWEYKNEYARKLKEDIDNIPMTAAQRDKELAGMTEKVREHMKEVNAPYNEALQLLEEEFWEDARNELAYPDFLDEKGISKIESEAYLDGHAEGYGCVFSYLSELSDFLEGMKSHFKK